MVVLTVVSLHRATQSEGIVGLQLQHPSLPSSVVIT